MSSTLGEKLRQAREERGITITEVAEQTRISPHYLELIENDDYRTLPGGIFNKGFVKSYAKYVGIDESEALQDYSKLITVQTGDADEDPKTYRPEVLTDDRSSSSNLPTIIFALVILGLMTFGILSLVNYIQSTPSDPTIAGNNNQNANAVNANAEPATVVTNTPAAQIPATDEIKLEFKPASDPISVEATVDGRKASSNITAAAPQTYTAKQSVRIRYYKGFANQVQLTLNGKQITPPPAPARGNGIEFEINKDNITQILQSGQIAPAGAATAATAGR